MEYLCSTSGFNILLSLKNYIVDLVELWISKNTLCTGPIISEFCHLFTWKTSFNLGFISNSHSFVSCMFVHHLRMQFIHMRELTFIPILPSPNFCYFCLSVMNFTSYWPCLMFRLLIFDRHILYLLFNIGTYLLFMHVLLWFCFLWSFSVNFLDSMISNFYNSTNQTAKVLFHHCRNFHTSKRGLISFRRNN